MRVLVLLYIFLCFATPAFAYVEENDAGMTKNTAGEQTTNLYKLKTRTDYLIKRLKKMDNYATRSEDETFTQDVFNVEDISVMEQKDKERAQNKKLLEDVVKAVSNPAKLKNTVKPDVFSSLTAINEVRDIEIATSLQRQLRGESQ